MRATTRPCCTSCLNPISNSRPTSRRGTCCCAWWSWTPNDGFAHYNLGVLYRYRMDEDGSAAKEFQAVLDSRGQDLEEIKEHARQELETLGSGGNQ